MAICTRDKMVQYIFSQAYTTRRHIEKNNPLWDGDLIYDLPTFLKAFRQFLKVSDTLNNADIINEYIAHFSRGIRPSTGRFFVGEVPKKLTPPHWVLDNIRAAVERGIKRFTVRWFSQSNHLAIAWRNQTLNRPLEPCFGMRPNRAHTRSFPYR